LKIKLYMKKVFLALTIATACYACGGNSTTETSTPVSNNDSNKNSQIGGESTPPATPATPGTTADTSKAMAAAPAAGKDGKALIEASDCRTCHHDKDKLIGPAYADVAKKYPSTDENIKHLASKVIAGGTGVWGQIPMVAHPNISQEDAEAMVKYVLSIK
jgi:cytochrome c